MFSGELFHFDANFDMYTGFPPSLSDVSIIIIIIIRAS